MAQSIQIIPKFSYPHIETYINDYTAVDDDLGNAEDTGVKFIYVVTSPMGKDNRFVKITSRTMGEKLFGKSEFSKNGQPYMQALACAERDETSVWLMRVMPENSTYANAIVSAYFKADTADDYADAHKRKFRIKFASKSAEDAKTTADIDKEAQKFDGETTVDEEGNTGYIDAEGYSQKEIVTFNSAGRGIYGNQLSVRIAQNIEYEKEYGIKIYSFEVINFLNGLNLIANYVGAAVTSPKYSEETATLIDDVIARYTNGTYPIDIHVNEENVTAVYDQYILFLKDLHEDLVDELEQKLVAYNLPDDVLNGTVLPDASQKDQYAEIVEIKALEKATRSANLPDADEFDIFFGKEVGSEDYLPAIAFPAELTSDVDITASDYDANDYTSTPLVVFDSTKGVQMVGGSDGYFATPRTVTGEDGDPVSWTKQQEVDVCLINAYNGVYDRRILSAKRIPCTAFFDANYSFEVKEAIQAIADYRNDCRVYLDAGFVDTLSTATINSLRRKYAEFDDHKTSVDIQSYYVREPHTQKRCRVTISFFLSQQFANHINIYGTHIPFVKEYATLSGHIKDSVAPTIEEYDTDIQELMYNNRFNYFECVGENQFRRSVQNTRQVIDSDLLEESNSNTLYLIKRILERDADSQIYNFAEEGVRQAFCEVENAKFASWEGREVQSINVSFATSRYEFNHSILHLYVALVFRGLTKRVIIEIDINKRQYAGNDLGDITT